MKKLNKMIFHNKILISTKLPNPIRETRVSKLVFITIPCLKFWAQRSADTYTVQYMFTYMIKLRGQRIPVQYSNKII